MFSKIFILQTEVLCGKEWRYRYSMYLREIFSWYFTQVWLIFNSDVYWLMHGLSLIQMYIAYFGSNRYTSINIFTYIMISNKFKIWNVCILEKMTNLIPNNLIQFLAWHFHRLVWNKLAKDVPICMHKNSVDPLMLKQYYFFLDICTKTCQSHLNFPSIREFFVSSRWNKLILT